jgi:hypothetical protein
MVKMVERLARVTTSVCVGALYKHLVRFSNTYPSNIAFNDGSRPIWRRSVETFISTVVTKVPHNSITTAQGFFMNGQPLSETLWIGTHLSPIPVTCATKAAIDIPREAISSPAVFSEVDKEEYQPTCLINLPCAVV